MRTLQLKIPPVVILILTGVFMGLTARATPDSKLQIPARPAIAATLLLIGIVVVGLGVATFRQAKTTVNPRQPQNASALVTNGVYRVTRNPMYLGFLLMLSAWAVFLAHWTAVPFLPAFVLYMNRFQIVPEEKVLAGMFGAAFAEYASHVRRWL